MSDTVENRIMAAGENLCVTNENCRGKVNKFVTDELLTTSWRKTISSNLGFINMIMTYREACPCLYELMC